MSFSQDVWKRNFDLYQKTLNHPFNQELAQGTLDQQAFSHYVIQDAHYLLAYGRALAVCAAKAFEADDVIQFAEGAKVAIVVERSLHDGFMLDFGISKAEFENTPLTLACHHYTSFLTATAWSESYPVILAALLPCFWIYAEVGNDIVSNSAENNPYQAWVDTYSGEEFHTAVKNVIATIDRVAERCDADTIEKMHQAYRRGAELEWLFWDSAYKKNGWLGLDA
ncbi:thiaminase II [Acinetobacter gerneri]|uniref:Aminopyrimidine aminohydrolase n=1 Tax=Acinetobacter gerneri TaxID=202952 RepID=A0AAW8JMC8_9GAMM|nr:thiaminase II [Acinetobacter gerneri]MDQ9011392.1 thiaminase II [Acinetobacter gerneri]MDQ9015528.1 thiaminase II [Acinetobacter gerneri]MDQ9026699.1 thiaminase II [Acinetobacter gerneri]MDQ9053988.1 thiaminase II [Acinetobacter gerneri]MDQ9061650.1 thiaminase II [Acinetobacter gerneri]